MAAAPVPKPDEPAPEPASDADGWALLDSLRRRLDDQTAQGRRTQAQVGQLAESIAALVAEQRRRSLWLNVNSFIAYLVFTVLCGTGCYLLYRSRAHELAAVRDQAAGERAAAVRRADEALARVVARESADAKAWEVYQLLELGQRAEAAAKLAALRDQPLSKTERALLTARVRDGQAMEADAALKAAAAALKAGRLGDAIKPLEAALAGDPPGARAAMIHYYLGVAYARAELGKAAAHLQAAIAGDVDQADVRFHLASVLDRSGDHARARAEYERFAAARPPSQLTGFALRRAATLGRMLAAASGSSVPAPRFRSTGSPAVAAPPVSPPASPTAPPTGATPAAASGSDPTSSLPGSATTAPRGPEPPGPAPAGPHPGPAGAAPAPVPRSLRSWSRPAVRPGATARPAAPTPPPAAPADPASEPPPAAE